MSSNDNEMNELRQQLAALRQEMQQRQPPPATAQVAQPTAGLLTGWAQPPVAPADLSIIGVSVPVSVQTNTGNVRVYIALPAECGSNMSVLQRAVENLIAAGVPVDAWQPRSSYGGSNRYNRGGSNWNR